MLDDLRFAIRKLRQQPAVTAVAMLTLALGIGLTAAVFSLIQGVLLTPPPYAEPEQLVVIPAVPIDGQPAGRPRRALNQSEVPGIAPSGSARSSARSAAHRPPKKAFMAGDGRRSDLAATSRRRCGVQGAPRPSTSRRMRRPGTSVWKK